jgi:hypothetical protein
MHKLILATVAILLAGSFVWKAEAAMTTGVRSLPLMNSYTTIEKIGWKRRYRRGYYGYGYYGYGYRPYGYYGYGYRPYGYGYGWRY